ncbi:MAG TPA: hypothetical protein VLZ83_14035 [Edaphocola sp.]|nr:hypothetical protein [Edaphocola sp.]
MESVDFAGFYQKYMDNLKKSGKKYCVNCFDDRNIDLKTNKCEDCLKMEELLKDIRPVN